MSARGEWRLLFWILIGMPLLVLGAVEAWPTIHRWLTGPAPWWLLPSAAFLGFFVIVVAALWHDLFPRKPQ